MLMTCSKDVEREAGFHNERLALFRRSSATPAIAMTCSLRVCGSVRQMSYQA